MGNHWKQYGDVGGYSVCCVVALHHLRRDRRVCVCAFVRMYTRTGVGGRGSFTSSILVKVESRLKLDQVFVFNLLLFLI